MAEKIVSPGVFTEEKDLSFLPQGIANIGAAFIGPTIKGPAMVPTTVGSYGDFVQIFGDTNPNLYLPYAAKEYLSNGGTLTVVRTLHDDGYASNQLVALVATGSYGKKHIGLLHPSQVISENSDFYDGSTSLFEGCTLSSNESGSFVINISGSYTVDTSAFPNAVDANTGADYSGSLSSLSGNYLTKIFSQTPNTTSAPAYLYTWFKAAASASLAKITDAGRYYLNLYGSARTEAAKRARGKSVNPYLPGDGIEARGPNQAAGVRVKLVRGLRKTIKTNKPDKHGTTPKQARQLAKDLKRDGIKKVTGIR